jgi:DnaJ family protein A protein 2
MLISFKVVSFEKRIAMAHAIDDDYFALLDLQPDATDAEIKRAYRLKALKHHPDKCPDDPNAGSCWLEIEAN